MSSYKDALQVLRQAIEAGCPGVDMVVYDARKLLGIGPYTPESRAKDLRKAKVIYSCLNRDVPRVNDFIQASVEQAYEKIGNPEYQISYAVQHYPDISYALLSGAVAHSVRTWSGVDLRVDLQEMSERWKEILAVRQDQALAYDLENLNRSIAGISDSSVYISRYISGSTYRVSMYDAGAGRHLQANVSNVLILSGTAELPRVSLAPPRKTRSSIYDGRRPEFSIRGVAYYMASALK